MTSTPSLQPNYPPESCRGARPPRPSALSQWRPWMTSAFCCVRERRRLDYTVAHRQGTYAIDVTGCRYAQFYKGLGQPELGFLRICGVDVLYMKRTRPPTIMQGRAAAMFATGGTRGMRSRFNLVPA